MRVPHSAPPAGLPRSSPTASWYPKAYWPNSFRRRLEFSALLARVGSSPLSVDPNLSGSLELHRPRAQLFAIISGYTLDEAQTTQRSRQMSRTSPWSLGSAREARQVLK